MTLEIDDIFVRLGRFIEVDGELHERLPLRLGITVGARRWEIVPKRVPVVQVGADSRRTGCEIELSQVGFDHLLLGGNPQRASLNGDIKVRGEPDQLLRANDLFPLIARCGESRASGTVFSGVSVLPGTLESGTKPL